jgi:UDP:flavonoid glycosyltransferase YjiC (YdhE family)
MDGFYPDVETLIRFIEQDRALIEEEAPDVVVIDMRMPSAVAAELAEVPTVTINHFLPFTGHTTLTSWRRRLSMLRHPLRIATRLGSIFDRDPFRTAALQRRFDEAREELGLPPKDGLPITGPCTAFTTTPFLDPPTGPLPEGWHLVGPVTWSASGGPVPPETGDRPLVFVSQGTLGSKAAIEEIAQGLSGLDAEIAVVTMGAADHGEIESLGEDITALDFVDNDVWLEAADVAVLHGGHITMSAAARAGTPAVVIPDGRDHWAWAAKTTRLGTGISLYRPLLPGSVGRAVRKILTDPGYTERADRLAGKLEGWSGEEKTADLIERVAAEPELGISGTTAA